MKRLHYNKAIITMIIKTGYRKKYIRIHITTYNINHHVWQSPVLS